jgi:glycosyltransferase involved in cell wall biosynthesis
MKILFVHGRLDTYVRWDVEALEQRYLVRRLHFRRDLLGLLRSGVDSIAGAVWADVVFCWFGGLHAVVPSLLGWLLGRRVLIASSGYDCANVPEIKYGNMQGGLRSWVGRLVFRLATHVLAPSEHVRSELIKNARVPSSKIRLVLHGIPLEKVGRMPKNKSKMAICVGIVHESNLKRKGMLTFVEAAAHLPDVRFVLAGEHLDGAASRLQNGAPKNVEMPGFVPDVAALMLEASVLVQVSAHEGFGVAVAEGMLRGCIPVVTDRAALPEVVGDTGVYVPCGDAKATAQAIELALGFDVGARRRASDRVRSLFSMDARKSALYATLDELIDQPQRPTQEGHA